MCVSVLPTSLSGHHWSAWCPRRPEDGTGSLELDLTAGHKLPCGFWDLVPGALEEQPVFLTVSPALGDFIWGAM